MANTTNGKASERRYWSEAQHGEFLKRFSAMWRANCTFIAPPLREPLIDSFVLGVIAGLEKETVPVRAIDEIRSRLHENVNANFPY